MTVQSFSADVVVDVVVADRMSIINEERNDELQNEHSSIFVDVCREFYLRKTLEEATRVTVADHIFSFYLKFREKWYSSSCSTRPKERKTRTKKKKRKTNRSLLFFKAIDHWQSFQLDSFLKMKRTSDNDDWNSLVLLHLRFSSAFHCSARFHSLLELFSSLLRISMRSIATTISLWCLRHVLNDRKSNAIHFERDTTHPNSVCISHPTPSNLVVSLSNVSSFRSIVQWPFENFFEHCANHPSIDLNEVENSKKKHFVVDERISFFNLSIFSSKPVWIRCETSNCFIARWWSREIFACCVSSIDEVEGRRCKFPGKNTVFLLRWRKKIEPFGAWGSISVSIGNVSLSPSSTGRSLSVNWWYRILSSSTIRLTNLFT